jgi:hypothetical protein
MTRGSTQRPSSFASLAAGTGDVENGDDQHGEPQASAPSVADGDAREELSVEQRMSALEDLLRSAIDRGAFHGQEQQNQHGNQDGQADVAGEGGGAAPGVEGGRAVFDELEQPAGRAGGGGAHRGARRGGAQSEEDAGLDEDRLAELAGGALGGGDDGEGVDVAGADAADRGDAAARFGVLFGGHPLGCEHDVQANPWPRVAMLRQRTSHYSPDAAGDTVSAKIFNKLGQASQKELCTLVPLASYLWDASMLGADLLDAVPAPVGAVLERLLLQLNSCLSFAQERLDELEALSKDKLRAASFGPLYDNERAQSGARSALGAALHDSHVQRFHTRIAATAAADDVRSERPPGTRALLDVGEP